MKAEAHALSEQVRELSGSCTAVQNATAEAKKAAAYKTTAKGFTFEDTLHVLVEQNAVPHQDLAFQTGRTLGSDGNQQGDEVATLNPDDTRGVEANIVFECKDKKVGLKKILDELDGAMKNRDATVGVAVFATPENAPTNVCFTAYGCKAVLVLDKENPDPLAVRLAYMWARWVAKRELASDTNEVERPASSRSSTRRAGCCSAPRRSRSATRPPARASTMPPAMWRLWPSRSRACWTSSTVRWPRRPSQRVARGRRAPRTGCAPLRVAGHPASSLALGPVNE